MTRKDTSSGIGQLDGAQRFSSAKFDLNQAVRGLADSTRDEFCALNINLILDSAPDLPKLPVDGDQVRHVLCALLGDARQSMLESGNSDRSIIVRTELNAERTRLSLTYDGLADPAQLSICAEIVQDQAGELYLWRPRDSSCSTIIIDLPAEPL